MPVKQNSLSAKDFRDPLLVVLGELTSYQVGREVKYESTYAPVFKRMQIKNIEEYGRTEANIPWVERWTQFAFQDLCDNGLATRAGRGKWLLTPAGIQESLTKSSDPSGSTKMTVNDDQDKPQDSVPAGANGCISIPVGPNLPVDPYHDDPYIRGLAAKATECLGSFSESAPTCKGCTLRNACVNASAVTLSRLAIALDEEDKRKVSQKDVVPVATTTAPPEPPKIILPDSSVPSGTADYSWMAKAAVNVVNTGVRTKCRHCGQVLEKGTPSVWVHLPGAAAGKGSAIFHKECYTQVTGKNP